MKKLFLLFLTATVLDSCIVASDKRNPQDQLISYVDGFLISRALYTVAELKIADELVAGPKTATQIASSLHLNADAVHRLLRMLSAHGMFSYSQDGYFGLNEISQLLTTAHPQSMRGFVLHEDLARWQAYGFMKYSVETGKPAFNYLFNKGYFDYIAQDAQRSEQFDLGMATFSETENRSVAQGFDFSSYQFIVDVGGGVGGLLTEIIARHDAQGVVYELPHLHDRAQDYVANHNLSNRIDIVQGSFLTSIVSGGDLYILKRILHDWDDATCLQILKNCVQAMHDDAKIVVFDCVVPNGNSYDISKDIDIIMMIIFGGKERTAQDFHDLFNQVGLQVTAIKPVAGTMLCAIEGSKKL